MMTKDEYIEAERQLEKEWREKEAVKWHNIGVWLIVLGLGIMIGKLL